MKYALLISRDFPHPTSKRHIVLGSFRSYYNFIFQGGYIPIMVPPDCNNNDFEMYLSQADMVVFQGGDDIDPERFGQELLPCTEMSGKEYDDNEFRLLELAIKSTKPILGVCRGFQMINVYYGGSLFQDIPLNWPKDVLKRHQGVGETDQWHSITLCEPHDNRFFELYGPDGVEVNSNHHQALDRLGKEIVVLAKSTEDGIAEAITVKGQEQILGVQWHPERMDSTPNGLALWNYFQQ